MKVSQVELQVRELLGAKTEEDLKPKQKVKGAKKEEKPKEAKKKEEVIEESEGEGEGYGSSEDTVFEKISFFSRCLNDGGADQEVSNEASRSGRELQDGRIRSHPEDS